MLGGGGYYEDDYSYAEYEHNVTAVAAAAAAADAEDSREHYRSRYVVDPHSYFTAHSAHAHKHSRMSRTHAHTTNTQRT